MSTTAVRFLLPVQGVNLAIMRAKTTSSSTVSRLACSYGLVTIPSIISRPFLAAR